MKYTLCGLLFLLGQSLFAQSALDNPIVVLVDKAKYELHLAHEKSGFQIFKTYPTTIGKNSGDKMIEGDMKTPEGIYLFTQKFVPPHIKRKFGAMAFYMDYPNVFDKKAQKTGFDIMLHSTDDPARLERPQDSDGCIVVNDERIKEISSYIQPQKTRIFVYDQLKPEHLLPTATSAVEKAFNDWIKAWSAKDLDAYISMYSDKFTFKGMNLTQYKEYKSALNKKYHTIEVIPSNVKFYSHPKYDMAVFSQEYISKYKDGRTAFAVKSSKQVYFTKENGALKIISEGN